MFFFRVLYLNLKENIKFIPISVFVWKITVYLNQVCLVSFVYLFIHLFIYSFICIKFFMNKIPPPKSLNSH